jgi:carbohydrate-selective porin OprB
MAAGLWLAGCLGLAAAEGDTVLSKSVGVSSSTPSLWDRETLTGDWGGARSRLAAKGVEFAAVYTGECLANVQGGARTGALYQGLVRMDANLDIEKAGGWEGGVFHASGLWIQGSEDNARNDIAGMTGEKFLEPSNISAFDTVRLYELWLGAELPGREAFHPRGTTCAGRKVDLQRLRVRVHRRHARLAGIHVGTDSERRAGVSYSRHGRDGDGPAE